ncbi:hypothetical protein AHAS_Ahas15G0278100 [Arachis hypogaea]
MLRRGYAKQVKEVRNLYIHEMELLQIEKELKDEACRESLRLFDGHNGTAAAIYAKENLLNNILSTIPSDLNRDEWIAALPGLWLQDL